MNIVLIGSGNVATALAKGFYAANHLFTQIYSPTEEHAKELARQVNSPFTTNIAELDINADVYIIAVKDDAIADTVNTMPLVNGVVVHTSGATDVSVLKKFKNYGVLYAPQSFTKEKDIDLEETAFCIEANSNNTLDTLKILVTSVSSHIHPISSKQRLALHVAAVLANNFTHHLLSQAQQILQKEHIPMTLLKPIIEETFQRLGFSENTQWEKLQTGPAIRDDKNVMQKHIEYLSVSQPPLASLYEALSKHIQNKKG